MLHKMISFCSGLFMDLTRRLKRASDVYILRKEEATDRPNMAIRMPEIKNEFKLHLKHEKILTPKQFDSLLEEYCRFYERGTYGLTFLFILFFQTIGFEKTTRQIYKTHTAQKINKTSY